MSRQHIGNDDIHREVFNLKYAKLKTKTKIIWKFAIPK